MKTNAKQRERWEGIGEWRTDDYAGPVIDRLIADVNDATRLLKIHVNNADHLHAPALDHAEVVAFLKEPKQ